jgi:hypothetical protein
MAHKWRFLFCISTMLQFCEINAQTSLAGLGIEVGGGSNQLFVQNDSLSKNRTRFVLTPEVRIKYAYSFSANLNTLVFIGYTRFGGQSDDLPNGYKEEYWFDAVNIGVFLNYQYLFASIGIGYEANRHLKVFERWYGITNDFIASNEIWREADFTEKYSSWSHDIAFRISAYWLPMNLTFETWFGLTNLFNNVANSNINIRENHFRLLLGYQL